MSNPMITAILTPTHKGRPVRGLEPKVVVGTGGPGEVLFTAGWVIPPKRFWRFRRSTRVDGILAHSAAGQRAKDISVARLMPGDRLELNYHLTLNWLPWSISYGDGGK